MTTSMDATVRVSGKGSSAGTGGSGSETRWPTASPTPRPCLTSELRLVLYSRTSTGCCAPHYPTGSATWFDCASDGRRPRGNAGGDRDRLPHPREAARQIGARAAQARQQARNRMPRACARRAASRRFRCLRRHPFGCAWRAVFASISGRGDGVGWRPRRERGRGGGVETEPSRARRIGATVPSAARTRLRGGALLPRGLDLRHRVLSSGATCCRITTSAPPRPATDVGAKRPSRFCLQ